MVSVVGTTLGLPDDYFVASFKEPTTTLRLIRYPSHANAEDNQFGFAPHIDTNFLTLLARSALPGLEVRTSEGEWIRPPHVPNTFVVNTGEMLGRYSNDRYIATPHRVINDNNTLRHAIPFFSDPDSTRSSSRCRPASAPTIRRNTNHCCTPITGGS